MRVTRSSKPPGFGKVESAQLHTMSDASTTGYGQCSYLRLVDKHGTVHVSFQMGKARVAPKKTVSIPTLELAAATVSVKMTDVLRDELSHDLVIYYVDAYIPTLPQQIFGFRLSASPACEIETLLVLVEIVGFFLDGVQGDAMIFFHCRV